MTTLVELADVAVLSPRVLRVLGQNPGLYTLQGTNTYVVGEGSERILVRFVHATSRPAAPRPAPPRPAPPRRSLDPSPALMSVLIRRSFPQIDTGDGVPAWATLLEEAARTHAFTVTKVVLTHWHHDHVSGLADVQRLAAAAGRHTPVEVYKCPDAENDGALQGTFLPLEDGGVVRVPGATLRAVATPGHTADHLCLFLEEERALFSGDMVLGQGTAVFSSLREYMASLAKARELAPTVLYPGHGPVVPDGSAKLSEYLTHRNAREQQVVAQLRAAGTPQTIPELVSVIYAAYPVELHLPAQGSIRQHLQKLLEEGRVRRIDAADDDDEERWALLQEASL